jgi:hypothetical protein
MILDLHSTFAVASGSTAGTVLGVLALVPPQGTVNIESLSSWFLTSGVASSTVHIADSLTPTVPLETLVVAMTGTPQTMITSASSRGRVIRNLSTTITQKLVVVVGAIAPAQNGDIVVRFKPAPVR